MDKITKALYDLEKKIGQELALVLESDGTGRVLNVWTSDEIFDFENEDEFWEMLNLQ